jgi:hypothetical protein
LTLFSEIINRWHLSGAPQNDICGLTVVADRVEVVE